MAVTGPDFIALQVRDLEKAATFYEEVVGLSRAPFSPPHAVVFDTQPTFAVRDPAPGVDLDAGPLGLGVALWLHDPDAAELHTTVAAAGATVVQEPFDGPFGTTFVFQDLDGYLVTIHSRTTAG
ncbi:putative enzyme related to lactoylglutathione lyase [Leifsonia sp. AK011]|uniref:VOC family protein n=1 Tax=Leifsonia sp. AK011 TaxID=2723075 RepID=UPI0015C72D7C|nr:VOC family protein [Leifsonia sp. AK011]NYF09534.1 putative enzyme related to lactoylglutathione lyase [Leifsonia sp. AK011]